LGRARPRHSLQQHLDEIGRTTTASREAA